MAEGVGESKYDVGSTVYVPYEGGTHYQARVLKKEVREHVIHGGSKAPMWFYLVHYMGWNKKYDEWVEEVGCALENPESLIIPNKTKPKGGAAHAGAGKYDYAKPQISIAIPGALKQQLIQDHDAVKEDKNIPMPRSPCIVSILDSYKEHARQQSQATPDIDEQVAHGIRNYFDRTLALLLLYNEERAQADGLLKNGDSPSSIYGAEHLLRLFLKLPDLLPIESSTEEQYRLLQTKLHDLLDFLSLHRSDYFLPTSSYITAVGPSTHTAAAPQPSAAPPTAAPVAPAGATPVSDVAGAIAPAPGAVKLAAAPPPLSAAGLAQQPQPMQH